jgi:hypothetical protein
MGGGGEAATHWTDILIDIVLSTTKVRYMIVVEAIPTLNWVLAEESMVTSRETPKASASRPCERSRFHVRSKMRSYSRRR